MNGGQRPPAERAEPSEDGVDATLIRRMLSLTPDERFDVLGTEAGGQGFEQLVERSRELSLGAGVRILDLEALIELEERTGREKDRAQLPLLRRALEERRRR